MYRNFFYVVLLALVPAAHAASPGENWEKNCVGCHGDDGKGKTRLGRKAGVKDLSDKAYQAKSTDELKFKAIKEGIKNKKGDELMEAFGDRLSDPEITALVAFVRTLAK